MRHDTLERWRRRAFLKRSGAFLCSSAIPAGALLEAFSTAEGQAPAVRKNQRERLPLANPMVGTGWRGHMFPGAVAPFGLVQLSPDSSGPPDAHWNVQGDWYEWQHCSGYQYRDNIINGFSHTHLQGTGGIDLGDILVMPLSEANWFWNAGQVEALTEMQVEALGLHSGIVFSPSELGYRSFFTHNRETARPGYYGVYLETPEVQAELTSTTRCGMHRYRYAGSAGRHGLLVDLVHGLGCQVYAAELTIESSTRITGKRSTHGWAKDREIYFVLEVSQTPASMEISIDGTITPAAPGNHYSGKEIKIIFTTQPGQGELIVRVGISPVSVEGAASNLAQEIPAWDFDARVKQSEETWTKALASLDATFSSSNTETTFWSAAYHALVAPATYSDVDGSYRGQDRQNHRDPSFTKYTSLSIWDIYRGEFPFLTLAQPQRVNDIIQTLILDYQQLGQHALPMWPLWGNETWSMVGFHAAAMILGAYVRGFRDFDMEAAYAAIRDTALMGAETRGNRELQAMFRKYGYVPCDLHAGSVSSTLDLSFDYWCAGTLARLLGKAEDSVMFLQLSQGYQHVYNPATGFMQGKASNGAWRAPFVPHQESGDYIETDAWQASFSVPHDIHGLIKLYGGDSAFIEKLDKLFTAPSLVLNARPDITGMVGQDAQGNEPSNHHPYLYAFAGAPWKTQYWSRKVAGLYNNTPAGVPGNDDCGQLSSWFVFASLGFYPVNAAAGVYVLGSPLVDRAILHSPLTGSRFRVVAQNNSAQNVFIQRAELNGQALHRSWLTHQQITTEGELHLHMGPAPNKDWATAPEDRPPSGIIEA